MKKLKKNKQKNYLIINKEFKMNRIEQNKEKFIIIIII